MNPFSEEAALIQQIDLLDRRIIEAKGKLDFKKVRKLEAKKQKLGQELAEIRTGVLL